MLKILTLFWNHLILEVSIKVEGYNYFVIVTYIQRTLKVDQFTERLGSCGVCIYSVIQEFDQTISHLCYLRPEPCFKVVGFIIPFRISRNPSNHHCHFGSVWLGGNSAPMGSPGIYHCPQIGPFLGSEVEQFGSVYC